MPFRRRITYLGLLASLCAACPAMAHDYVYLSSGLPAGSMTVEDTKAGRVITFRYDDGGRGADLRETVKVGDDGLVVDLSTKGVDYFKAPVAERFARAAGKATWSSQADAGESPAPGMYRPFQATPEDDAILLRALLKSPGQSLALFPQGSATARKLLSAEATGPGGQKTQATLYAIDGLNYMPTALWIDQAGDLLFAGESWQGTIRKGWEASIPALLADQEKALLTSQLSTAKTLQRRSTGAVVLRNVNLFDPKTRSLRAGMTVVVNGNRIEDVLPVAEARVPAGARVIDGTGQTLFPGMWDMHAHIIQNFTGLLNIAGGVTSVRDMGNNIDSLASIKAHFDKGDLVGPRIFSAGLIDGPGPYTAPIGLKVSTPAQTEAAINRYADLGYDQIKVYSSLDPALLPVAIHAAHARGLRVSGHIPAGLTADQAIDEGLNEIQHINMLLLNFMPDIKGTTNTLARLTGPGERSRTLDLSSPTVRAFIAKLKRDNIVCDPTVTIMEEWMTAEPRTANPSVASIVGRLPSSVARASYGGGLGKDPDQIKRYDASFAKSLELLLALYKAGVSIVPGTDNADGFHYHRELELWAKAGIPNADILYYATLGSASINGHDKELGSIEPGKLADMVLINGDPVKDISDIRNASLVIKDGNIFDPGSIYAAVGVKPGH
ncbi:MAG: amidohydrolase family protein [Pseudomonadota bacterium]